MEKYSVSLSEHFVKEVTTRETPAQYKYAQMIIPKHQNYHVLVYFPPKASTEQRESASYVEETCLEASSNALGTLRYAAWSPPKRLEDLPNGGYLVEYVSPDINEGESVSDPIDFALTSKPGDENVLHEPNICRDPQTSSQKYFADRFGYLLACASVADKDTNVALFPNAFEMVSETRYKASLRKLPLVHYAATEQDYEEAARSEWAALWALTIDDFKENPINVIDIQSKVFKIQATCINIKPGSRISLYFSVDGFASEEFAMDMNQSAETGRTNDHSTTVLEAYVPIQYYRAQRKHSHELRTIEGALMQRKELSFYFTVELPAAEQPSSGGLISFEAPLKYDFLGIPYFVGLEMKFDISQSKMCTMTNVPVA